MKKSPNGYNSALGKRLKRLRENAKLTQSELASIMGVHRLSIIRWESGQRSPTASVLAAFAAACNCTLSEVLA